VTKILLDAREMEYPIPLQLAMAHLKEMDNSTYLYMINFKKPIPLIEMIKEKGFAHHTYQDTNGVWHILIAKNNNINLEELLDV